MKKDRSTNGPKKDRLEFSRVDDLIVRVILVVTMVASGCVGLVAPLFSWAADRPINATFARNIDAAADHLPTGVGAQNPVEIDVAVNDPSAAERVVDALPNLLIAAIIFIVCLFVLRLQNDLRRGEPFSAANVRRVRNIAALVGIGASVVSFFDAVSNAQLLINRLPANPEMDAVFIMSVPLPWLLAMLLLLIVAEVFRRGTELRDDVEGLV